MGAAFGLMTLGAEEVLHWLLRHPNLRWTALAQLVPLYVLLPALGGAAIGAIGFRGVAAALWTWAAWMVILLSGAAYGGLGFAGLPVVVFGALAAVVLLLFLTRSGDHLRWGALVGSAAWGIGVNVLNNSALGGTWSPRRLLVNVGLVIIGVALALAVGKGLERFDRDPRVGVMALLLGLLFWAVRVFLPNPTAVDLPAQAAKDASGPPVLVVFADGLRADHIGFFGDTPSKTPFLDGLAAKSLAYEQAYASAPWSLPATATVMTGLYPAAHGAGETPSGGLSPLEADRRTLGEYFKYAGYSTALIVTRPEYGDASGLGQGFDYHRTVSGLGHEPALLATLDMLHVPVLGVRDHPGADLVTDRALAFLESRERPSWLLVVQYSDLVSDTLSAPVNAAYAEQVSVLDRELKRLLKKAPPEAWIVVLGTYGAHLGERHPVEHVEVGGALFQENVHVPLLVYKPRNLKPATVVRNVRTADVLPTMVELIGGSLRIRIDGETLFEVFGYQRPRDERPALSGHVLGDPGPRTVRSEQYKLHYDEGDLKLFDVAMDATESHDVSGLYEDIAAQLSYKLPDVDRPATADDLEDVREHYEDTYAHEGEQGETAPQ